MKILIPILSFGRAGGYRVLSELSTRWVKAGHRVDFLVPAGSPEPYFPTIAGVMHADVRGRIGPGILREEQRPPLSGWRNVLSLWRGLLKVGRDYDVVLANHSLTAWPAALAPAGGRRFYYIQAYEAEYFEQSGQPVSRMLARWSYRLPLVRIVNAPLYREYREIRAEHVVPPGIDLGLFHRRPPRDLATASQIILGCIGRSEPSKGTRFVLEAFALLHAADPRYRLRVAYGNLPEGFAHEAVEIVVPRNDAELADYYRSLDILVAPGTVQHGAPHYPVIEAMASGVPVVTTGYLPADTDNSWIVPNERATGIVDAVRAITADPGYSRRVDRARRDVEALGWSRVSNDMLGIMADAIGQSPAPRAVAA